MDAIISRVYENSDSDSNDETDDNKDSLPDKKEDFDNSSFIGMWADREDMQDSEENG